MKYLKKFELFEAVIMPEIIKKKEIFRSFEDVVEFGIKNDFDVVNYDDFYNSLDDLNKKTVPPRNEIPFFAAFNPKTKRVMFVLNDPNCFRIPIFSDIMNDIISHERIHAEQSRKSNSYNLPNPNDRKSYFSNKEEIMAFSFSIANDISKISNDLNKCIKTLDTYFRAPSYNIWLEIQKYCNEDVIKRYRKYIYLYLEKMLKEKSS